MHFRALFLVGAWTLAPVCLQAQARRPPLPTEAVAAVADGQAVRGIALVQVEKTPCLSLRDVQRLVGGRITWKRMAREAVLVRDGREARFTLDAPAATVDGVPVPLATPVRWWTGQAYVPLPLLLTPAFQSFAGATIQWNESAKMLMVAPVPDVSSPRFTAQNNLVRVSFDLGPRVDYRVLRQDEGTLFLRLFGGRAGPRERLEVQNPLLTAVDILPRARSTDIVFSLAEGAGRPFVTLQDNPRRLTVEVHAGTSAPSPAPATEEGGEEEGGEETAPSVPAVAAPVPVLMPVSPDPLLLDDGEETEAAPVKKTAPSAAVAALSPIRVIVVDPGHGGKDAGAVGKKGTLEKDVNLAIAKALAKALRSAGGYEVRLTRTTDEFISLQDRAEFANKIKADLFISVHCNAALSRSSKGFEIYFLSERSTDDAAAAVARRENASIELEGPADKVQAKVAQLLWSLAKTETLNDASELAALVHKHAQKELDDVDTRGVKQAGFYVLKWAQMPAVLVESAFITNPKEESLLRSSQYINRLIGTVVRGVQEYERRKTQARLGKAGGAGGS